jgi:hypothetical protein
MKNIKIIIIVFLFSLLFWSCRKENTIASTKEDYIIFNAGQMINGKMGASLNNQNWLASSEGVILKTPTTLFGLEASTYTEEEFQRVAFYIENIPFKIGKYTIKKKKGNEKATNSTVYRLYADGDVAGDGYDLEESNTNNFVEVTAIDTVQKTIKGTFEAHYIIQSPKIDKNLPDKLDFLKGTFDVKMIKR